MVRVRFAPSPTGYLHVGGARTALYNYVFAKKNQGKFILRIEDTDVERSTKESEQMLIEDLLWLGLDWDEGPRVGGPYEPYRQSERTKIYQEKAYELVKKGKAYFAYVYPEEIEAIKNDLLSKGLPPHYKEEMFEKFNTPERKKEFESKDLQPVIFFKMPHKTFSFIDLIKGPVSFGEGSIGDFIILRSNGLPTYNFAVVVDDMTMEITHVIRGDDHLSNSLRQLALYEAFEIEAPKFAHVSMILGPDGKKLSKRHGATSISEFREKGYLPEALINYLMLLGWSHPEGKEILSMDEIIESFDLSRVNTSPAIFDLEKLRWINSHYIRECNIERIYKLAKDFVVKKGILEEDQYEANAKWIKEAIDTVKDSLHTLEDIPHKIEIFLKDFDLEFDEQLKTYLKSNNVKPALLELLKEFTNQDSWCIDSIVNSIKKVLKEFKPDRKSFYMALRKLITNSYEGPDLARTIHLIGRNKVLKRMRKLKESLQ